MKTIPPIRNTEEINGNIIRFRRDLNNDLTETIYNELEPQIEMGARIVFSFTALIQRGNGEIAYHVHTFRSGGTFNSLSEIKDYIERCEGERLSLEGAAWIRAYLPPEKKINKPGVNEGGVEFREVQIKVINTRQPLVGCGRLPDELRKKRCIYSVDDKDDNLCVWRCLAILMNIIAGKQNPEKFE